MSSDEDKLEVDTIVDKAFEYFDRFVVRGQKLDSVLLEELAQKDDGWIVTIGFDGTRKESSEPAYAGALAGLSGLGSKKTTTVREIRHIHLGNDGRFQRIT